MLSALKFNPLKKQEKTYFGLSLCKQIIDQLNGDIGFKSTPGKGSEFVFTIDMEVGEEKIDLN